MLLTCYRSCQYSLYGMQNGYKSLHSYDHTCNSEISNVYQEVCNFNHDSQP